MREYDSFQAFWPFYLGQHAKPATRTLHYFGSTLAPAYLLWVIQSQTWWGLLALPVAGYLFPWIAHALIERNKPATWTYPLWSLMGDYKMFGLFLTGKLDAELRACGITDGEAPKEA